MVRLAGRRLVLPAIEVLLTGGCVARPIAASCTCDYWAAQVAASCTCDHPATQVAASCNCDHQATRVAGSRTWDQVTRVTHLRPLGRPGRGVVHL